MAIAHRFGLACGFDLDASAKTFSAVTHGCSPLMDVGTVIGVSNRVQFRKCTRALVSVFD
jgi:hypothetical protein